MTNRIEEDGSRRESFARRLVAAEPSIGPHSNASTERTLAEKALQLEALRAELARETTERQRMEVELRLAQKLEAVGQLSAGIAHEINTPIQYVGDSVHFLREAFADLVALIPIYRQVAAALADYDPESELLAQIVAGEEAADVTYLMTQVPRAIDRVQDGAERVGAIVRAMREFAHTGQRDMTAVDIHHLLMTTLVVARSATKHVAEVETRFGDLPSVECHATDMNQVFLNLIVNAAQAIEETGKRGRITIETRVDGDDVVIAVGDDGPGIPAAIQERIYDPFFTTKPVGKGTGHGLAVARTIVVDRHRGSLTLESEPGRGTTFQIRIPIGRSQ